LLTGRIHADLRHVCAEAVPPAAIAHIATASARIEPASIPNPPPPSVRPYGCHVGLPRKLTIIIRGQQDAGRGSIEGKTSGTAGPRAAPRRTVSEVRDRVGHADEEPFSA